MRDPKRIDKMILMLKEIWLMNPDLRMGQLMDNLSDYAEAQDKTSIFYLEDDKMEKIMLDYINDRCVLED